MIKIILFCLTIALASAQYTKLQWSTCGVSVLDVKRLDITPMPIRHPGVMNLKLAGSNTRVIRGAVKSDVKIKRTVSGLTLDVSCYLVSGNYVGSCVYSDLCQLLNSVLSLTPENCPASLVENGIDCKCPFNLPVRQLDINADFNLPDAATTPITWIGTGEFDLTVKGSDSVGQVTCLNLKFSVRPK